MLARQRAKNHFSSKFSQRDKDNNHDNDGDDVSGSSNGGERHFIAKDGVQNRKRRVKKKGKVEKSLQHIVQAVWLWRCHTNLKKRKKKSR